ncbi:sulfate permease, SulP family protein [Clostridium pasteurianum DSM 525 = ATCC 6013]|uniref:Sulfate permease, SulP family protein n=1 Tax=Clostridium pasteurianum DSM 525 = ATCC 6013 TaxID=1262449 RepID=A0A0H3J841_CLOPA|nr:sulfate permease [Clostridium pasteurianum]AJA48078.1 sulfate permease, SulP family protein [Clostridium pasteurianum DSM 525 = ATCC 6013]AJA52066.1 sulfate permease, SulP family protein [Clostridium pasteurianum DSM 525 = ATCC 6013]AOZ75350.1 sulfate permease [Clostridium pasteurianum DSM 525 = ATCC 6013]AOZ79145.1 sulfate permease [Clostridium pasteurianum]ELP60769.1 sulfate permease [Clostridium pasteurianum DSM 525 = ATCC 6013]
MLIPKSITCIKSYTKEQFIKDFISGIIVAIIALPLSIALAIASGVSPEKGLYTAIIGGFIVSLLGGSKVQIGGPTAAFVVIVYGIIEKFGIEGLFIATIMAGIFLIIMGLLKFGSLIKYIPSSITTGFTNGIAVVLLSTEIKDFFGLHMKNVPSHFIEKLMAYFNNFHTINLQSLLISLLTIAIIILWPKLNKRIPGAFIAIITVTLVAAFFKLNVTTIGSQFGNLSSSLPRPNFPNINFAMINELMLPALTIAILGSVESLLSAVVSDRIISGNHRSNMELIAQGFANVFSAVFGGIPVTGAIARTAANIKNGGRTPVAGIVHAITLLIIMLLFIPYVKLIPMASLAAVLVVIAYNMGDWKAFKLVFKSPKSDFLLFIVTFLLTVFLDLVVAIGIGVVLSSFLFMRKMGELTEIKYLLDDDKNKDVSEFIENVKLSDHISIYEISGAFFFGAANKFITVIREMGIPPKVLIIKMSKVPFMDSTAYHSFEMLNDICKRHNTKLIILKIQIQPFAMLKKYGFVDMIGEKNFCSSVDEAIEISNNVLNNQDYNINNIQIYNNTAAES